MIQQPQRTSLIEGFFTRNVATLGVSAVLAILSFLLVVHQSEVATKYVRQSSLVLRQSLLVDQITHGIEHRLANQNAGNEAELLRQKLAELEWTHTALAFGSNEMSIPRPSTGMQAIYFEEPHRLHDAMLKFIAFSKEVLDDKRGTVPTSFSRISELRSFSARLTPATVVEDSQQVIACTSCCANATTIPTTASSLDAAVQQLEIDCKNRIRRNELQAGFLLAASLATFVGSFLLVTRPLINRVETETSVLEATRRASEDRAYELQQAIAELKALQDEDSRRARAMFNIMTDLKRERTQLTKSNADLEQFAYVASHDLKEPLRMVANYTRLLENEYADQLDDEARKYIGYASGGAQRMSALIEDLLSFSRVGRMDAPNEPVDLGFVLQEVTTDLSTLIDECGAEVVLPHDLPMVMGSKTRLAQLFQNLLGNALKFRHSDRIPRVAIECEERGDFWEFAITDNGIGIEPEYFDRIFQVFQRLHTADEYPGTGIGLAVCKKIVENHGGQIWVESGLDGTTFRLQLPTGMVTIAAADEETLLCPV